MSFDLFTIYYLSSLMCFVGSRLGDKVTCLTQAVERVLLISFFEEGKFKYFKKLHSFFLRSSLNCDCSPNVPIVMPIFWISTGCAIQYLIIKSERGNGIRNSWLDLLNPYRVAIYKWPRILNFH